MTSINILTINKNNLLIHITNELYSKLNTAFNLEIYTSIKNDIMV